MNSVWKFEIELARTADAHVQQQTFDFAQGLFAAMRIVLRPFMQVGG